MGGGAGIQIKVMLEQFYIKRSRNDKRRFIVVEQPVISSWEALGYEDGMRNIKGDLLKAEVIIQLMDTDWMKANGFRPGDRIAAWAEPNDNPHTCIWAGYVRGKWQDRFPLSMGFDLNIEGYGAWVKATLVIKPADPVRFNNFWEDVFDFIAEAEDEGEEDAMSEEQVDEYHWELVEEDYGALSGARN